MGRSKRYSPEVRERAVRMVFDIEQDYALAVGSDSGGGRADRLFDRRAAPLRQSETDQGRREGVTSDERERLTELEREFRELRRANTILRQASAYFAAAELDRQPR